MTATFQQFCETTLDTFSLEQANSPEQANRYPLTVLAHAYLQDWYQARPIDGGVAFEAELRKLALDGSLASLTVLDTFLDSIRPQLANDTVLLSQNVSQRNLLNFIAFYAGAVYAYHAHSPAYWLTFAQLTTRFPNLAQVISDEFSYSMAVSRQDLLADDRPFFAVNFNQTTFFPLVAILERLYPTLQTANNTINHTTGSKFGYLEPSLAHSVQTLLNQLSTQNLSSTPLENAPIFTSDEFDTPTNRVVQDVFGYAKLHRLINNPIIRLPSSPHQSNFIEQPFVHPFLAPPLPKKLPKKLSESVPELSPVIVENEQDFGVATTEKAIAQMGEKDFSQKVIPTEKIQNLEPQVPPASTENAPLPPKNPQKKPAKLDTKALRQSMLERQEQARQQKITEALANPTINPKLLNQSHSMVQEKNQAMALVTTNDIFSSLEADLDKITVENTHPELEQTYQSTRKVVLQFQTALVKLPSSEQPIQLPEREQAIARQAITQLQDLVNAQHTGAILTLAILRFRGDSLLGVEQNTDNAMNLLQQAGKLEDSRAEKFLSKLYFSGELVEQNRLLAEDWLAKSASHGHPEAIELQQQLAIAQTLKASQQDDNKFRQQLPIGTAVLIVFLLIILLAVKI